MLILDFISHFKHKGARFIGISKTTRRVEKTMGSTAFWMKLKVLDALKKHFLECLICALKQITKVTSK